ncbi:phosphoribosyltransferase (plasmid) [Bacillus sp. JZ8]
MNKIILFPESTVRNNNIIYPGVKELITNLHKDSNIIYFISHDAGKARRLKQDFINEGLDFVRATTRQNVRNVIQNGSNNYLVIVGSQKEDLYLAANKKILLLNPLWSDIQDAEAAKYGIDIPSPEDLYKVIKTITNNTSWFYEARINEKAKVYSLTRANTFGVSETEAEMVNGFRNYLKHGNKAYYKVLLYHFIASISNNEEFNNVDIWAIMPSSGTEPNKDLTAFKEYARFLTNKRMKDPLFLRHKAITKSHKIANRQERLYCKRHFPSIIINPYYKGKLKGKTICILDDYLTNGTSFETLRNLLEYEKVKKIIFVSLGRFLRRDDTKYFRQDYNIKGNVYEEGYEFELVSTQKMPSVVNEEAISNINNLHAIFF